MKLRKVVRRNPFVARIQVKNKPIFLGRLPI